MKILNFRFKPVHKETIKSYKKLYNGKTFEGLLVIVENVPYIQIQLINKDKSRDSCQLLPIEEESLTLEGKEIVFDKHIKGSNGFPAIIIRNKYHAMRFPGLDSQYTVLCENWVYSGMIVNKKGNNYFSIKQAIKKKLKDETLTEYQL